MSRRLTWAEAISRPIKVIVKPWSHVEAMLPVYLFLALLIGGIIGGWAVYRHTTAICGIELREAQQLNVILRKMAGMGR